MRILGIVLALVLAVSLVLPVAALAQAPVPPTYNGLAKCSWDNVKWESNVNSWELYLQHWGRTPIQAMSRLRGLCGPKTLCAALGTNCPKAGPGIYPDPNGCAGGCSACTDATLPDPDSLATCGSCSASIVTCPAGTPGPCPTTSVIAPPGTGAGCTLCQPTCGFCWGVSLAFAAKSWAAANIGPDPRINNLHPNHMGTSAADPTTGACATDGGHGGDWGITGAPHNQCCALTWALQDNCLSRPYADKCSPGSLPAPNPQPPLQ